MRTWKPNHEPNALGAEIVVSPDATVGDILDLVAYLAHGHDPVMINVYLSDDAYIDGKSASPTEIFGDGFVGGYFKNLSSGGAYHGANEFRWMQERGRFAHLTGRTTPFKE
jgi:hypothetical protein